MTRSHFIAGIEPGPDHSNALWHVADDLRLLPRCGAVVSVTARVPVIDVAAFSSVQPRVFHLRPGGGRARLHRGLGHGSGGAASIGGHRHGRSDERGHHWNVRMPAGHPVVPDLHDFLSRLQARRRLTVDELHPAH